MVWSVNRIKYWGIDKAPWGSNGGGPAPPELWTPAFTTTTGWFDSNDSATFDLIGGQPEKWRSKGTNTTTEVVQYNASHRFELATAPNGLDCFEALDGGETYMSTGSISMPVNLICSVQCMKDTAPALCGILSNGNDNMNIRRHEAENRYRTATTPWASDADLCYPDGNVFINGADTSYFTYDVLHVQSVEVGPSNPNHNFGGLQLSGGRSDMRWWQGLYCEVVIMETIADRELTEGYLAWKWGFGSDLDPSHPYHDGPPMVYYLTDINGDYLEDINGNRLFTVGVG